MNYNYHQYRPGFNQQFIRPQTHFTGAVKNLIIANVAVFLFMTIFRTEGFFLYYFGLVPRLVWSKGFIWQLVTYMFIHGGFGHIFMNMFVLWMFGSDLERTWGSREFFKYYIICGIGAGAINVLVQPNSYIPIIGASGAIYGLLVAFAMVFPDRLVYIYFLFPVKVKYLVVFLAAVEFFTSMSASHSNIAHFAHLGGMLVGYIYMKGSLSYWKLTSFKYKISSFRHRKKMEKLARKKEKEEALMQEVDRILDKINQVGFDNLSRQEKKTLEQASERLSKDNK